MLAEDRLEAGALIDATIISHDPAFGLTHLQAAAGIFHVPLLEASVGTRMRLRLRAQDVILSLRKPEAISALNILEGKVVSLEQSGLSSIEVCLNCNGDMLIAWVSLKSAYELGIKPGRFMYAIIKSVAFDHKSLFNFKAAPM